MIIYLQVTAIYLINITPYVTEYLPPLIMFRKFRMQITTYRLANSTEVFRSSQSFQANARLAHYRFLPYSVQAIIHYYPTNTIYAIDSNVRSKQVKVRVTV
jgi:hypothetical protein